MTATDIIQSHPWICYKCESPIGLRIDIRARDAFTSVLEFRCHGAEFSYRYNPPVIRRTGDAFKFRSQLETVMPFATEPQRAIRTVPIKNSEMIRVISKDGTVQGMRYAIIDQAEQKQPITSWRPTCALCKRPVERVEFTESLINLTYEFQFECHGRVDLVSIPSSTRQRDLNWREKIIPFTRDALALRQIDNSAAGMLPKATTVKAPTKSSFHHAPRLITFED